jgi:serine/threonine protein kinase
MRWCPRWPANILSPGSPEPPVSLCFVRCHGVTVVKNNPAILMEYCPGGSLDEQIDRKGMPVDLVIRYGCDILSGVRELHSRGIIMLDLKPGNVLLRADGQAVLADFGLAKHQGSGMVGGPSNKPRLTAGANLAV